MLNGTSKSLPRHRLSVSPWPCHSASLEPNAYGASPSASSLSLLHNGQSSAPILRTWTRLSDEYVIPALVIVH
jgi:hypothetical protein